MAHTRSSRTGERALHIDIIKPLLVLVDQLSWAWKKKVKVLVYEFRNPGTDGTGEIIRIIQLRFSFRLQLGVEVRPAGPCSVESRAPKSHQMQGVVSSRLGAVWMGFGAI